MKVPRILLVDDDAISNKIAEGVIDRLKFADKVITKTDGRQALDYLKEACKNKMEYPNLILLDLKMPVMDGFDFLHEFEKLCQTIPQDIIVVILTGTRDPDDYVKLIQLGNYYSVNKPITSIKLEDIYHRFFRNREMYS